MIETPTLAEVIRHHIETQLSGVFTALVGVVQSFDAAARTCTVLPAVKRPVLQADGSYEAYATTPISDVPVLTFEGGGFRLTLPLSAGDGVLLICTMTDAGSYMASGSSNVEPGLGSTHNLGSCFAIPGVIPTKSVKAATSHLVLEKDGGASVHVDDVITLGASAGADFLALAAKVDTAFSAIANALSSATPAVPAGPDAGEPGFLAFKTSLAAGFQSVAATKVKGV